MFLDEGFDPVAMEGVAAAAGVSKGTLYARYPSKEALFHAVVEHSVKEWSVESSMEDHLLTDDIAVRLRHHARMIGRSLMKSDVHSFQRLIVANRDRFPTLARSMYTSGYLFEVGYLVSEIEAAAKRDGKPARNAESVARLLICAIVGWQAQEDTVREVAAAELEVVAERAADLLIAARAAW